MELCDTYFNPMTSFILSSNMMFQHDDPTSSFQYKNNVDLKIESKKRLIIGSNIFDPTPNQLCC